MNVKILIFLLLFCFLLGLTFLVSKFGFFNNLLNSPNTKLTNSFNSNNDISISLGEKQDITLLTFSYKIIDDDLFIGEEISRINLNGYLPSLVSYSNDFSFEFFSSENRLIYQTSAFIPSSAFYDNIASGSLTGGIKEINNGEFVIAIPTAILKISANIKVNSNYANNLIDENSEIIKLKNDDLKQDKLRNSDIVNLKRQQILKAPSCDSILYNGNPKEKLDFVFIGNNWNNASEFYEVARNLSNSLMQFEPYKSRNNSINIHVVSTILNNASYWDPPSGFQLINFTKTFPAVSICPYDKIIFVDFGSISSPAYALNYLFSYIFIPSLPISLLWHQVNPHEIGHLFGLADEYDLYPNPATSPSSAPNCEYFSNCPLNSQLGSSCYSGCEYTYAGGRFRDSENDIMRMYSINVNSSNYSRSYGFIDRSVILAGIDYFTNKSEGVVLLYNHAFTGLSNELRIHKLIGAANNPNLPIDTLFSSPHNLSSIFDVVKDSNGFLQVGLYDLYTSSLYYSTQTSNTSSTAMIVDSNIRNPQREWKPSIALNSNGLPSIAYSNGTDLMYAWYDGASWHKEVVMPAFHSPWVNLKFNNKNIPYIVAGDNTSFCLAHLLHFSFPILPFALLA